MAGIVLVVLLLGMSTAVAYDSPTLVTYTITNTTIEPPQTTSIDVAFSEYVSATIEIENASGDLVKELYSSPNVKNPNAKTWDGTYTDDTAVPDGTYTVNVTGVNTTTGLSVINTSETITVATSGDTIAPTVTANTPAGTGVAISTVISVTFSEAMNQTSAEDAFSTSPAVNGSLGWDNDTMTFTPDADLAYSATYEATIGTGAEDLAGNNLEADYVWNFTTVEEADTIAPVITDVACDTPTTNSVNITWTTNEDSDSLVKYGTVSGIYPDNESDTTMTTSHSITLTGLTPETTYYFVVNSTDASGNPAESDEGSFTTAAIPDTTQPVIMSATLSPNAILSNGADSAILEVEASSGDINIGIASVTVNLSAIGGPDEQELDGAQMMGSGTWSTTFNTTSAGTFDLTVTVTNDAGNSATADVTLTAGPYKYTLPLKQGWNMISLPYDITAVGIDTTQKLGDLITDAGVPCYYVARFNATSQTMECDLISPPDGVPQDEPYPIVGGQAYFVFVGNDKDVAVVGTLW